MMNSPDSSKSEYSPNHKNQRENNPAGVHKENCPCLTVGCPNDHHIYASHAESMALFFGKLLMEDLNLIILCRICVCRTYKTHAFHNNAAWRDVGQCRQSFKSN